LLAWPWSAALSRTINWRNPPDVLVKNVAQRWVQQRLIKPAAVCRIFAALRAAMIAKTLHMT
jgi:hypothetical protein